MSDSEQPAARILLAEDELLIAMVLQDQLESAGYDVLLVSRLAKGLSLVATQRVDVAILDINLAGENSFPLADLLVEKGVPLMFASGYGAQGLPDRYRNATMLQKPYQLEHVETALSQLLASSDTQR